MGKKVLGITVDPRSVTLAWTGGRGALAGCEMVPMPEDVYSGGELLPDDDGEIGSLVLFIKEETQKRGLHAKSMDSVSLCVNNSLTVVRPVTLPAIPVKELDAAVEYELSQSFPGVGKTHVIAFREYSRNKKEVRGIACFSPKKILEPYRKLIMALNYKNAYIDVAPNAEAKAYHAFTELGKTDGTCLICDIERQRSQFTIVRKNQILHSRQIPDGSRLFRELFCARAGIADAQFDLMSPENLLDGFSIPETDLITMIRTSYSNIAEQLQQTIEFHNQNNGENTVSNLLLAGGGVVPRLDEYIASVVGVPAEQVRPGPGVRIERPLFARALPAIGAAVRED